jgi:hypothetical protein
MHAEAQSEVRGMVKERSARRALVFALLASLLWPLPVIPVAPALERLSSSPLPVFLILPLLLAFPFLYRSRLLCDAGRVVRTGLLVFVSYAVFAVAFAIWVAIVLAIILFSGASIG